MPLNVLVLPDEPLRREITDIDRGLALDDVFGEQLASDRIVAESTRMEAGSDE